MLVQRAYDVESFQISGPPWMDEQRYSIVAKVPPETTVGGCKLMLQQLLAERFLLHEHIGSRPFRVYDLILSKGGPKFSTQSVQPGGQDRAVVMSGLMQEQRKAAEKLGLVGAKNLFVTNESMPQFAARLSQYLDRPAVDRTQLSGKFSLSLIWVESDDVGGKPDGPSFFAALREQLGLELRPATQDLRVIVVDSAERTPTGN